MKYLFILALLCLSANIMAQTATTTASNPRIFKMDSVTLKQYFFVMLEKGPRRGEAIDSTLRAKLQEGHMANIKRLVREGKILVAGPFDDDGNWRGIFIFDCDTKEEVEKLLATDPLIKAGRLGYEIHPWWTGMNSVFK